MKNYSLFLLFLFSFSCSSYGKDYLFVYFDTDSYFFNNADFRSYNFLDYSIYKSDQTKNTDDAVFFVYSNLGFRLAKRLKSSFFYLDMYTSGLWGNDNLETNNTNSLMIKEVYFDYYFKSFSLRLGRQRFSFGSSIKDYFFYDIIDGILVSYKGLMSVIYSFDVLGIANKPEGFLYSSIKKDDENMEDFKGKKISYRTGIIVNYLFIKTFFYYVYFGASKSGGAEIAENGLNNLNEPDNDFLFLSGLRVYTDWVDLTVAYSYGKDYGIGNEEDYDGIGSVINLKYDSEIFSNYVGIGYFSPGFCGFKGVSPGDILSYGYKGYFPFPYVGAYHFVNYEKYETYIDVTCSKAFMRLVNTFNWLVRIELRNTLFLDTKIRELMGAETVLEVALNLEELRVSVFVGFYLPYEAYYRKIENSFISSGSDIFYSCGFKVNYILKF